MSFTNMGNIGTLQVEGLLGLSFYKDELRILESRLIEVAGKNTGFETSREIEHFQNQFILQQNNISELRHKINKHVQKMGTDMMKPGGQINKDLLEEDNVLTDEYKRLEKIIKELRHEFNEFLIRWM